MLGNLPWPLWHARNRHHFQTPGHAVSDGVLSKSILCLGARGGQEAPLFFFKVDNLTVEHIFKVSQESRLRPSLSKSSSLYSP